MHMLAKDKWVLSFSNDLHQHYFSFIPKDEWTVESLGEKGWFLGVKHPKKEGTAYQYHLTISPNHPLITLRTEHHPPSVRLFGTVYHHLIHFLSTSHRDFLVHAEQQEMWGYIYKKKEIPLSPTHTMSRQILHVLSVIQQTLGGLHLQRVRTWEGREELYVSTHAIQYQWKVRFYLDESASEPKGYVCLDGTNLYTERDVRSALTEESRCIQLLQQQEDVLIAFAKEKNTSSFYDPHKQSIVLFHKHIPFRLECIRGVGETTYEFALRIGSLQQKNPDIHLLVEEGKAYIDRHTKKELIRAITEGRI